MNAVKIERIGFLYSNLTADFDCTMALTHEDASNLIWQFVLLLNLNCTRKQLDEIIHYWRQVDDLDIEDDCRLSIVCTYFFDNGLVSEEHELEPYFGGSSGFFCEYGVM